MKPFINYFEERLITEGKYPMWLRASTALLVLRLHSLKDKIKNETDGAQRDILMGQQNALLGVISGLAIGVGSTDKTLLTRMKSQMKR